MRILLVEDDECIVKTLVNILENQYYVVDIANDGLLAWELIETFNYDLILLDVILPKLDGIKLCQKLRSHSYQTPILLLTAQNSNNHKVMGLDAGADDYVVKPFDIKELLARIRVLLRRRNSPILSVMEWGNLRLEPATCEVTYGGLSLNLTPKEYRLLELFLLNKQIVFSRSEILDRLWSVEEAPKEDTVTAHIKGLRQKLMQAGAPTDFIETVYGLGYRLKAPVSQEKVSISALQVHKSKKTLQTKEALTVIWERLKVHSCDRITILQQVSRAFLTNNLSEELRKKGYHAAHKLGGSLGIFGFAKGSHLAKEIEEILLDQITFDQMQALRLSYLVELLFEEIQQPAFRELDKLLCRYVVEDTIEEVASTRIQNK
jgi:DNA-binding response OmpR family regulator/HPt (histidine-containing phosphotransfer) domain-containing protein